MSSKVPKVFKKETKLFTTFKTFYLFLCMRKVITFSLKDSEEFKLKLLTWAQRYEHVAYLDSNINASNKNKTKYQSYECLVGIDKLYEFNTNGQDKLNNINEFLKSIYSEVLSLIPPDQRRNSIATLETLTSSMNAVKELMT